MKVVERKVPIDIRQLSRAELRELLCAEGDLQQELFEQARNIRRDRGADKVLLRGVIEISNYCQKTAITVPCVPLIKS